VEPGDPEGGRLPAGQSAGDIADDLRRLAHRTLKKVTDDHADYHWNTMIAALMELTNRLIRLRGTDVVDELAWDETIRLLLLMMAPIAPHISEELWSRRLAAAGAEWSSVHTQQWPQYDETLIAAAEIELPVQINGKLRDVVSVPTGLSEVEIEQIVMARDKVRAAIAGQDVVRVIQVPNRLVNVVVRPKA
jgi:leucyl-tRNA synthetase